MKQLILLVIISLITNSCASTDVTEQSVQKHYFYFDKTHSKMKTYGKPYELRHLYDLDNYDPVIFVAKDSIEKEINIKELKNYHVKDYKWLNNLKPSDLGFFFHRDHTKKEFYLIEKRESNKILYLREVDFIMEIE